MKTFPLCLGGELNFPSELIKKIFIFSPPPTFAAHKKKKREEGENDTTQKAADVTVPLLLLLEHIIASTEELHAPFSASHTTRKKNLQIEIL